MPNVDRLLWGGLILLLAVAVIAAVIGIAKRFERRPKKLEYPYKAVDCVFTKREKAFYDVLKPIADNLGLTVFAKIRQADLLLIPKGTDNYMGWFNKIKAKHIDFVLVDDDCKIRLLIELDDSSHDRPDRRLRDEEVDEIFRRANLKLLHIRKYSANELQRLIKSAIQ